MGDYKPKVGDRVRVVIEGEVPWASIDSAAFDIGEASYIADKDAKHVVSVEKIEPPVTVFKPGDVVRSKAHGFVYSLGNKGYFSHTSADWNPWGNGVNADYFTSRSYELVDLSK